MSSWPELRRDPVRLPTLAGHDDDDLRAALIELSELQRGEWTLIGGQMVFLHAIELGVTPPWSSTWPPRSPWPTMGPARRSPSSWKTPMRGSSGVGMLVLIPLLP